MEIWEPKPPGTLWVTPGLLRDCFSFFLLLQLDFNSNYYYTNISTTPIAMQIIHLVQRTPLKNFEKLNTKFQRQLLSPSPGNRFGKQLPKWA